MFQRGIESVEQSHRHSVIAAVLAFVVLITALGAAFFRGGEEPITEAELNRQIAAEQSAYAAALRQRPTVLASDIVAGSLEIGDAKGANNHFEDYFVYESTDSTVFHLQVTSGSFAPDLVVTTPDGRRLAASMLRQTSQRAEVLGLIGHGRYEIVVTSKDPDVSGTYELSADPPADRQTIGNGNDHFEAELGSSGSLRAGRYIDQYLLDVRPNEPLIVSVRSSAFAPVLQVLGPEGEIGPPWGSIEQHVDDGDRVAAFRYRPTHEDAYMIYVSSEEEAATGGYSVNLETVRKRVITPNGDPISGRLGERSWYRAGRYIDTFRFDGYADDTALISVSSNDFNPRIELRRGERVVASSDNGSIEHMLTSSSVYELDVSSVEDGLTGNYAVRVNMEGADGLRSQSFSANAHAVGETNRNHHFEVRVTGVDIDRLDDGRVRIRLDVVERSLDFDGEWDEWSRRARYAWVTDDAGRRFAAAPSEARGGEGEVVAAGESRNGRLTFYGDPSGTAPKTIALHFPIGSDRGVTVSVPIRLER